MLTQIYTSDAIQYLTRDDWPGSLLGTDYHANIEPYIETLANLYGMWTVPNPTPDSPSTVYLALMNNVSYWPSWAVFFMIFDATTGAWVGRVQDGLPGGALFSGGLIVKSRMGRLFWLISPGWDLQSFSTDNPSATGDITYSGPEFGLVGSWKTPLIDEIADVMIECYPPGTNFNTIGVWRLSTKTLLYVIEMPDAVVSIVPEDSDRCYILCGNRVLVLLNYVQEQVLGAVRIPQSPNGRAYWNDALYVKMAWDGQFRRVLVFEKVPNNEDGSCAAIIRGFRNVPIATRLTTPIPLQAPRKGRTVPVLTCVLGDMNEGVGGNLVTSVVTGNGQLAGSVPMTDNQGRARTQVECTDGGSINIACSVEVP